MVTSWHVEVHSNSKPYVIYTEHIELIVNENISAVAVYSAVWSPNADYVLHTQGKSLVLKPVSPSGKTEQVGIAKNHDLLVLHNPLSGKPTMELFFKSTGMRSTT